MGCACGNLPGVVAEDHACESYGLPEPSLFPQSNRTECVEVYLDDMDAVPALGEFQVFVPLRGGEEGTSLQIVSLNPLDIITPQQGVIDLLYATAFACHIL